ncbi:hypothetical protein AWH56_021475 [Anaerobacillus isosaccharinicus]|uniref:Uncharacterized protein n=1 Tax=Anaerobacillus isosaccharinicus TaxID=1532552 RepID=A0A7S7L692_9BACI|nr:hypothetical protein [Anaerobacillus isosaccharinicus]MBA5586522.1 hypothetical protein [Anaerobacillus isosaccharinicus]QOY35237.1 hypothetical protein AWH56_021475 [Anaerobacillus isosaccharinicus]
MATITRGKVLRELSSRGRGTCPLCERTRIKLLYDYDISGVVKKVCKNCRPKKL